MTRDNITDILCIGAQRAMTSWLHQVLTAHPGVTAFANFDPVTSTNKEAHYWDWNHHRGADWYRILMRPLNDDLKTLDFTPEYAFLDEADIDECKALSPDARVIYLLRDPLARAVSAIRMRTVWASQNAAAEAVTLTLDTDFYERCKNAALHGHGAYAANLRRWRARFPDILVLSVEGVQADPAAAIDRILTHCALPAPDVAASEHLRQRAANNVWVTPKYRLSADCLHFLHGLTWLERDAIAAEGFTFAEGAALLDSGS